VQSAIDVALRLPVVRELEQDLRQCVAGAGTGS
jgi:hypothetical protein